MRISSLLKAMTLEAIWFGRVSYANGLKLQNQYIEEVKKIRGCGRSTRSFLLLLEHDPVYTVGLRSHVYSAEEEKRLKKLGASFYRTNRGGLITFHGPGQLVGYPIIDLASLTVRREGEPSVRVGVRRFVFLVEEAIIQTLHKLGLTEADRSRDTGVWVGNGVRKIAAIGINVRGGITSHGLALNCNPNLQWFQEIVPCGLVGKEVTSISAEFGKEICITDVLRPLSESFATTFQCSLEYSDCHLNYST